VGASLLRILVIVAIAGGAGLVRARNLPWVPDAKKIQEKQDEHSWLRANRGLTLDQLLEKIDEGAVVIDARGADAYADGHLALNTDPPVLNVPAEEIDQHVDRLMKVLGYPLVLYCTSNTCEYAEELYESLTSYGFRDIWIYFPGYEGIRDAGLPTTTGPDSWTGFGSDPNGIAGDENGEQGEPGDADPNTPDDGAEP